MLTARSYRKTAARISQTIRNAAKTIPTAALATIIRAGMPKMKKATRQAETSPASADRPADTRPEARSPRRTRIGKAAAAVEIGQLPSGS